MIFNAESTFEEKPQWYYLTNGWENNRLDTVSKGIYPNSNEIAQIEFELAYYDVAVQFVSYNISNTLPRLLQYTWINKNIWKRLLLNRNNLRPYN